MAVIQKTILLVEDETITAILEQKILQQNGYTVIHTHTGEEAIEAMRGTPSIDLILMDIDLGAGIDGTIAARDILKIRDIPVVFLSSHTEPEVVEKTEKITSYGYIVKNTGNTVLLASIKMAFKLFDAKIKEKEKETALQAANEAWSKTFDSINDIVCVIARDHTFIRINKKGCESIGLPPGEIIGKHCYPLVHGTDHPLENCPCMESFETGEPCSAQYQQGDRHYDLQAWPIYDEMNNVTSIVHIVKDITESVQAAEAFRESEMKYRVLYESSTDAIMTLEPPSWNFTSGNPATIAMFRTANEEEFVTYPPWKLSPELQPDGRPSVEKAAEMIETAMREGSHFFEWTHRRTDGEDFPANVLLTRVELSGKLILQGTVRDVTEQQKTVANLKRAIAYTELIIQTSNALVVGLDSSGVVTLFNRAAESITGYTQQELTGKNWFEALVPHDRYPQVWSKFNKLMSEGIMRTFENPILTKSGEERFIVWQNNELVENGRITGTISFGIDITERKRAEDIIRENEEKFNKAFHHVPALLTISAIEDGRYLEVNDVFVKTSGFSYEEIIGKTSLELGWLLPEDREKLIESLKRDGRVMDLELTLYAKGGHPVICRYNGELINIGNKKYLLSLAQDITEHKGAHGELTRRNRELESLLKGSDAVLENSDFPIVARHIFDIAREITGAVSGYVALLSPDGKENQLLFLESGGLPCSVDPYLPMPVRGLRGEAYATGCGVYHNDFMNSEWVSFMPAGHVDLKNVMFAPLNIGGKTVGIMGLANKPSDFTDDDLMMAEAFGKKAAMALMNSRNLQALKESEANFRILFRNNPALMAFTRLPERFFVEVNNAFLNALGYTREELVGRTAQELELFADAGQQALVANKLKAESRVPSTELKMRCKDGSIIEGILSGEVIESRGEKFFLSVVIDITERKRAEEIISQQVKDKEALLIEVHHRVKNNIAGIQSMLGLHERAVTNIEAKNILLDAIGRVQNLRVLYDKLLVGSDYMTIHMKHYLADLVSSISAVFADRKITMGTEIDDITMSAKSASAVGMIVNELVNNSMKYAFDGMPDGKIWVTLQKKENEFVLSVRDNGRGMPEGFSIKNSTGFGTKLVEMFAQQLKGTVSNENRNGLVCTVTFKLE